jgi:DNA replication protein DnaC
MHKDIDLKINDCLKFLHLSTVKELFKETAAYGVRENISYEKYLLILLEKEKENRYNNRISKLLKQSGLDPDKTMESFNTKRLPPKALMQVRASRKGDFLINKENILIFGNPGSGKTHLLSGIAQEQITENGKRIIGTTCSILVQELLIAKRDLQLKNILKKYSKYDAIVIDDIGYVEQSKDEMEVLFTFLADRYERASIMITSNLPFSKWEKIFKDPMTATAAIDRLIHHSIIIELNLPSYRIEEAKSRSKK